MLKDLPVPNQANRILEYDCSNVNDIARSIFEDELIPFEYTPPKDNWMNVLAKGKTTYKRKDKMKVRLLQETFDTATNKMMPKGTIMDVSIERGLRAINKGYAVEVEEEPKVEVAIEEPKEVKKAVKRTTKKKSE